MASRRWCANEVALLPGDQRPSARSRAPISAPADAVIAMQMIPQTYASLHAGHPFSVATQRYLDALAPQKGDTSGASRAAVRATVLCTQSAAKPPILGPHGPVRAGLFAATVVHSEAPSARAVYADREAEEDADACTDGADGRSGCAQA